MFKTTYSQKPSANQFGLALLIMLALPVLLQTTDPGPEGRVTHFGDDTPACYETTFFVPALQAAQHIAGVAPATSGLSGRFDVIAEVIVKNIGTTDLTDLSIAQNLSSPAMLGSTFVNVVGVPVLVPVGAHGALTNAAILPAVNPAFSGTGDLLAGGGLLLPGQQFVVRFRFEVNLGVPGAPAVPKFQATASGTGINGGGMPIVVSDFSDAGFNPDSTNPGWPGDTGGGDDPTPLTNCGNLVTNGLTCNNLLQVSFNQDCIAALDPTMILEGEYAHCTGDYLFPLGGYYRIDMVTTLAGTPVPDLVPETVNIYEIDGSYINQTLIVKVMEIVASNICWGHIVLKDKMKPVFDCQSPVVVNCDQDPALVPPPSVTDNCDPAPVITFLGSQILDNNICDDGIIRIRRTYTAVDASGNTAVNCVQELHVVRPGVHFPKDINWHCTQYNSHPNIVAPAPLHPQVTDTNPATPPIDVAANLPANVLANTGSGIVNVSGAVFCNYVVSSSDETVPVCGTSFKIIRTWTVIDWCNGNLITTGASGEDNIQVINVEDKTPPTITRPPFQVSANIPAMHPNPCRSQGFLLPPTISDNCNTVTVQIITPIGPAVYIGMDGSLGGFIPPPGLPVGTHNVIYVATDACGNSTNLPVLVTVVDDIAPVAVCDALTDVNLNSNGVAEVFAVTFDDGSNDNCCVHHFEVRRMTDPCDDGHDDTVFGTSVIFCCADVTNSPVMVVFRVFDCYNNYNECMVEVQVNDKLAPVIAACPPSQRISCDLYVNDFELQLDALQGNPAAQNELLDAVFGTANFADNCSFTVVKNFSRTINQCKEGTMTRTWRATDPGGLQSPLCSQTIFVDHVSDWVVTFPPDISVNCGETLPSFGEPQLFFETCEMIAISHNDVIFYTVSGGCFKIERTWQVINWCVVGEDVDQEVVESSELAFQIAFPLEPCDFNGDGVCDARTFRDSWRTSPKSKPDASIANQQFDPDTDPDSDPWDGYITFVQTMHVIDNAAPVFVSCEVDTVCISGTACEATVTLPMPTVMDCSPNVTITAMGDLGAGFGPFTNVGSGTYSVTFTANDGCNNQSTCTTTIVVKDCTSPTVYCNTGVVTDIMATLPPMVSVNAGQFDSGSTDGCSLPVSFSFSADPNDTVRTYFCHQLGDNPVSVWVTDAEGNQGICMTTVTIQANMDQCADDTLVVHVGGYILDEDGDPVGNVTVNLSGQSNGSVLTTASGGYLFTDIPQGHDLSITPLKDDNHLQGVTSFDLVLISRHILGIELFDSPYKIIAADANNSKTVTTFDIVEIRKLILHVYSVFPNNTSWRFVDKKFVFPSPGNPWLTTFPELININDVPADLLDADFVAIKIGDVNNSAASAQGNPDDRSAEDVLVFETNDLLLAAGHTYQLDFVARHFDVSGFQFTLDFDADKLEFAEVVPAIAEAGNFGLALLDEGAITASWNEGAQDTPGEGTVFRLVFMAKRDGRLSDMLRLSSRFTPAAAYSTNGAERNLDLRFTGAGTDAEGFVLYQNRPNPFGQETVISFYLPKPSQATLSILDLPGRTVLEVRRDFAEGYHEIRLNRSDLPTSGIFYYRLDTPFGADVKKMILLE